MEKENKIKRIVIWGLKYRYHTQRHIYSAFYRAAKKIGYETIWLEDSPCNTKLIRSGDLIFAQDPVGKMVPEKFKFEDYNIPVRDDVFYCLHNMKSVFTDKLNQKQVLYLQVFRKDLLAKAPNAEKWNSATYFDYESRTLFQPWGTNLMPEEFKKPTFYKNKKMFWVGNVWNDKNNHGNLNEISELKGVLDKYNIRFIKIKVVPDFLHIFLIRHSRIAPAIGGAIQVENDYLPCRMFKNISYGQLGFSNIKKFNELLGDASVYSENLEEMVKKVLTLSPEEYKNIIKQQQAVIKNYTYKNSWENIFRAFNL